MSSGSPAPFPSGTDDIVRFACADNFKFGSVESADCRDGGFHRTKTVLTNAIAEIAHSECIPGMSSIPRIPVLKLTSTERTPAIR